MRRVGRWVLHFQTDKMEPLTIELLDRQIGLARGMYRATRRTRFAETVARLESFKSHLLAKQMLERIGLVRSIRKAVLTR